MKTYWLITYKYLSPNSGNYIYANTVTEKTPVEYLLACYTWGMNGTVLLYALEISKEDYEKAKDKI